MDNKKSHVWLGSIIITLLYCFASVAFAAIDTSTLTQAGTSDVTTTVTYQSFNRVTLDAVYEVDVTNVSTASLASPVYLVITALPGSGVTVPDAAGTTAGGDPYYVLSASDIAPGATIAQNVTLYNPNNVVLTFTPLVYSTPVSQPLTVMITKPQTLLTVGSTPLPVEGTVNDPTAMLTVNGAPITINSDGTFKADVALREGRNAIVARAVKGADESTATISVALDLTPPYITVASPLDGSVVTSKFIAVSGLVNDIVRGTVSANQANVTVNGVAAEVSNRSYLAQNIELVEGVNTITVQASDQVGNTSSMVAKVTYKVPGTKHIELVSGQNQRAKITETLAQPFVVKLIDDQGNPATQQPVVFRVIEGDGQVGVGGSDQSQAVLVQTDANGVASTLFKLGTRAGDGNNHVVAKAVGYDGEVNFYASADTNPGDKVSVNSGNNQRGAAKQPLALPFVIAVTDNGANVIQGAQVEFKVTQGGGKFQNGQTSYTATTDSDGRATALLTLGSELGLDTQRVSATLVGTQLYAGFTASVLASGDPGNTSVSGVVLDNQDTPLPGVTVHIQGTTREAVTDVEGQFKITSVPVGPVHILVDGSTTKVPGEWPTLAYNLVTVAGADNPLREPVYMVKLDTKHAVWVGAEDKEITVSELPGFKLTVKKGSVTFPNGEHEGYMSVTPVNTAKIPMAPPNGMQPKVLVTIQPTGTRFDPPAPLQLPNVDGFAPGAEVEMFSFDHDLEQFVSIGLGTVSTDGTVIKSNTGVGVIKAGWHCGAQPSGSGCACNCGECKKSDGACDCVPDPSQTPTSIKDVAGDCHMPSCDQGYPHQVIDQDDFNATCAQGCDANGNLIAQDNGVSCDDGVFCTEDDSCENGVCAGTPIPEKDGGTTTLNIKLDQFIEAFNLFGKKMGILKTATFKYTESENKKLVCCELKKQMDVEKNTASVGLNVAYRTDKLWVPFLSKEIFGIKFGAFVQVNAGGNGLLQKHSDYCADSHCWGGTLDGSGGAEGGLGVEAGQLVSMSGSLSTALKVENVVECEQDKFDLSFDGFKGKYSFELFDGFFTAEHEVELVPGGDILHGTIPLP